MPSSITRLDEMVREAGIPIFGMRGVQGNVSIDFDPSATDQQKTDAAAIVAGFDWTPRKPKSHQALIAGIASLLVTDRSKLFSAVAADLLRRDPRFAVKLGINILGDEPDV